MSDAPVNNVVKLGGQATSEALLLPSTNALGFFSLFGYSSGNNVADRLFKNGVFYQVPNGVSFEISSITVIGDTAGDRTAIFSDTVTFTQGSALASLTAPLYQGGTTTQQYLMKVVTAFVPISFFTPFTITQNRFVGFNSSAGNIALHVVGREV